MYTLVRRFIKTGLGFLAAGVALGVWMLVRRELFGIAPNPDLVSAHAHAVLELEGTGSKDERLAKASLLYCAAGFFD